MEECLILLDDSNIFIEGKKFSARKKGTKKEEGDIYEPTDWSWRLDFGSLLKIVANGHKVIKAILVGSTPPPNDSLWEVAKTDGFEVKTFQRSSITGAEKAVDTEIVASGLDVIYQYPHPAILKLISGDGDLLPLITRAYNMKWETELWGFKTSLALSLAKTVNRVKLLDDVFDQIGKSE
jgi:uncharacterized LabA/DUF88 family protein